MEQKPNYINGDSITILYLYIRLEPIATTILKRKRERGRKWRRFDSVYIEKKDSGIN